MQVVSFEFLIFLPIVVLLYYVIPKKVRYIWLLITSYYFYMSIDAKYALFLVFVTLVTYAAGRILEKTSKKKLVVTICLILNLAVLGGFKYLGFITGTISKILNMSGTENSFGAVTSIIVPVGISFYMFQAIGYIIDVYRGKISAERNILKYALFVSFFPNILSGPIERAGHMLPQFNMPKAFSYDNMRRGLLTMLWGYFLKLVLADRMAIVVDTVYGNPSIYGGTIVVIAVILYTLQIYCDFAGYSAIAIGAARILGIEIMENFECPYLAGSVAEFWRRWHISLSSWFKDYLYIPLGGNRKGTIRKYVNIMIVFLVSGLWHGAGWTFVIWGGLHGLYQVIGKALTPARDAVVKALRINRDSYSHRLLKIVFTFGLVSFAWIFFRAGSMTAAVDIIKGMRGFTPWIFMDGSLYTLGISQYSFGLMMIGIVILAIRDILSYRGIKVMDVLCRQGIWLRWSVYIIAVMVILVCGIWGAGYNGASFIYYNF